MYFINFGASIIKTNEIFTKSFQYKYVRYYVQNKQEQLKETISSHNLD